MSTIQETGHFLDYWRVIQSRKEIVIAVSVFVIVAGVAITMSLPKVFMASTRIAVRQDTPVVPLDERQSLMLSGGYDPYFLRTQFEILQSRPILYEVIRNLNLQQYYGRLYNDDGSPVSIQDAYKVLSRSMKVQQYRDTNLIEVRIYQSTHRSSKLQAREMAMRIANEIAMVYRDQRMKTNRDETQRGLSALQEAYVKQQKMVEEAESRLEAIRKDLGVTGIGSQQSGTMGVVDTTRLQQLEANRLQARNQMLDRKTRLDEIEKLSGEELLYSAAYVVGDQNLQVLRQQLIEAEVMLRQMLESYGEKHPEVLRVQATVNDIKKKLDETLKGLKMGLQTDYGIAKKELEAIEGDLATAKASDITAHGEQYLPFYKAESELNRQRQIRDVLEMRLVQERIALDLPRTPVEVTDPAEMPAEDDPVSPNILLNTLLSIILGLGCGIGLAFFVEYMDTSLKTVEDIEKYIGAPIMGVIPQKVRPLIEEGPESRHAEAYRVLRTNIQFSKKLAGGKMLCLTSGGAGEGKSLTLCNLAYVCSQLGERTLIVDSDMRRPTQHKMLNISNRVGLADILMHGAKPEEVIKATAAPNLDFLPSGKMPQSAYGILNAQRMRDLVQQLRPRYEWVLFDAPPIMGVSDASVLSSEVDGVLLVVQPRSYPRVVAGRAKSIIENIGGNLIGIVLNNINMTRDYYYYYHSYYYAYHGAPDKTQEGAPQGSPRAEAPDKF